MVDVEVHSIKKHNAGRQKQPQQVFQILLLYRTGIVYCSGWIAWYISIRPVKYCWRRLTGWVNEFGQQTLEDDYDASVFVLSLNPCENVIQKEDAPLTTCHIVSLESGYSFMFSSPHYCITAIWIFVLVRSSRVPTGWSNQCIVFFLSFVIISVVMNGSSIFCFPNRPAKYWQRRWKWWAKRWGRQKNSWRKTNTTCAEVTKNTIILYDDILSRTDGASNIHEKRIASATSVARRLQGWIVTAHSVKNSQLA